MKRLTKKSKLLRGVTRYKESYIATNYLSTVRWSTIFRPSDCLGNNHESRDAGLAE